MARATRPRRHHAQREDIELWMTEEKGVQWIFRSDVPISQFDLDKSLRNQARINQVLNPERLETYTEAMRRGDRFPAVIAYKQDGKYVAIDGNHRLQAAKDANLPVSVYELAKETKPQVIIQMTYEANAKHGLPNSVEDRQLHAVFLIRSGATSQENAAAALNLSRTQVQRAWAKAKADDRAHDVGLLPRQWDSFPAAAKARLGAIRTDEGFAALTDLAWRAQLNTEEIDKHVVELNRSRSAVEQKKAVDRLKTVYRDRIQSTAGGLVKPDGRTGMKSPKVLLYAGLGQIMAHMDKVDSIVADAQDAEIQGLVDQCNMAIMFLDDVKKGLEKKQKGE